MSFLFGWLHQFISKIKSVHFIQTYYCWVIIIWSLLKYNWINKKSFKYRCNMSTEWNRKNNKKKCWRILFQIASMKYSSRKTCHLSNEFNLWLWIQIHTLALLLIHDAEFCFYFIFLLHTCKRTLFVFNINSWTE